MMKFKVGDKVEWETTNFVNRKGWPRWNNFCDTGGIGEYTTGVIIYIGDLHVTTRSDSNDQEWDWKLKYLGNPGYVRHISEEPVVLSTKNRFSALLEEED